MNRRLELVAYCTIALAFLGFGCSKAQSNGGEGGTGGTQSAGGEQAAGGAGASGGESGTSGGESGTSTTGGSSGNASAGTDDGVGEGGSDPGTLWDWNGVIGTGQSLAVGQFGTPAKAKTQPYNNLKLSTGTAAWPLDPEDPSFALVPLTEPIGRPSTAYPSAYPTNIAGETPHAAMANQITALVTAAGGGDHIGVHGEFGENGQCMTLLKKGAVPVGVTGRAYEATLIETQAVARLAAAGGKTYGVSAIIVTHGECDSGNMNYEADLFQLWSDYNTDIAAITGQTQDLLMVVSQQNAVTNRAPSTTAQWRVGVDHPSEIVCSGPKYQYPYYADSIHLVTDGYEQLGEKYGQIYYQRVILGRRWQPLYPTSVERTSNRVITVRFHVPVPPLAWETTFTPPHQALVAWSTGRGFEVRNGSAVITISSVEITGNAVTITCASDLPASNVFVGYAMVADSTAMAMPFVGTFRWGLLRDSDPFVGTMTQKAQPNFAVAFELPVP